MKRTKRIQREVTLKDWINKVTATGIGRAWIDKLESRGFSVLAFETCRTKDLELMLALVVAGYCAGCSDTRSHFAQMKSDQLNDKIRESIESVYDNGGKVKP